MLEIITTLSALLSDDLEPVEFATLLLLLTLCLLYIHKTIRLSSMEKRIKELSECVYKFQSEVKTERVVTQILGKMGKEQ